MREEAERLRASCRVCLRNRGVLNIFLSDSALAKLRACAPIQISEYDGCPHSLCEACANDLDRAYNFWKRCKESEKTLESFFLNYHCKPESELKEEISGEAGAPAQQFEILIIKKEEADSDLPARAPTPHTPSAHTACTSLTGSNLTTEEVGDRLWAAEIDRDVGVEIEDCKQFEVHLEKQDSFMKEQLPEDSSGVPTCAYCPQKLSDSAEARAHARLHKEERYECEVCGKVCKGARRIQTHNKTHLNENRTCEVCGLVVNKYRLDRHVRSHSTQIFECEVCKKTIRGAKMMEIHLGTHSNVQRACELCGLLVHKYRLKGHIADKHTSNPKECPICNKLLTHSSSLWNHLQRHIDMGLECELCGKKYRNKISMRMHIKTHTEKKMIPCSLCDKRFSSDKYKKAHEQTHSGVKHECTVCQRAYAQRSHLRGHYRNKHPGLKPTAPHAPQSVAPQHLPAADIAVSDVITTTYLSP